MSTLHLLFSHTLTPDQEQDAHLNLGVGQFKSLSPDLQELFSNVPPDLKSLDTYLAPIQAWIKEFAADPQDYILIQGDFGATYFLVDYCKQCGFAVPVYATTERQSVDVTQADGSVVTQRTFRHKMYREY